jgi:glycosyltransferase involved in cell wall biosynthesis
MNVKHGDELVVGYVGAFNRRKGVDYLLRAFSALGARGLTRTAKLVLVGPKSLEYGALVRLAEHLHIDPHVEFRGYVAAEELAETYNSFDVCVLPSEWEGFGFPILEAQRCGVPVIVRNDAHIPEEVSACCLKATSEEDMAEKIFQLLTDQAIYQSVAEQGLDHSNQFIWHRTIRQTVEIYEGLLA